jgi:hypothetical protein
LVNEFEHYRVMFENDDDEVNTWIGSKDVLD